MDDASARSMFLFGTEDAPDDLDRFYPDPNADPDALTRPDGWRLMRRAAAEQILADDPPETWATAQRLVADGLDRTAALNELAKAWYFGYAATMYKITRDGQDPDDEAFTREMTAVLDELPLPEPGDIEQALADAVAAEQGIGTAELVDVVTLKFGAGPDSTTSFIASHLLREAIEDGDTLDLLPGERVVNRADMVKSVMLTHRLTSDEIADGILAKVDVDLCLFGHAVPLVGDDGDDEVDVVDARDGSLGWRGPDGWLAEFAPGDLVGVRLRRRPDGDDIVSIERLAGLESTTDVASVLADAFDRLATMSASAMSVGTVATTAVVDEPGAFADPQPPISELCAAAGLELRGAFVGTTPEHWSRLAHELRHDRLHEAGDDQSVHRALDVLEALEEPSSSSADVRRALRTIADEPGIVELVVDELLPVAGDWAVPVPGDTTATIERLVREASRPREVAVATFLAAVADERAGDPAAAEARLVAGYADDRSFPPLVDRVAWYASDRGDAATALRVWSSLGVNAGEAVEVLRDVAEPVRQLGRNDRCWCGSGRKYKACHLGKREQASLADRVPWLWHKGKHFLTHWGFEAKKAVVLNVVALAGSDVDAMRGDAVRDPLVTDTALFEGGWFVRFVEQRGVLLPDDERLLAARWLDVRRSVFDVESIDREEDGTVLRDLRTDERFTVRTDGPLRELEAGSRWCLRVVPDGVGHQVLGGRFAVAAGSEDEVLALCDRAEPIEICAYAGSIRL